MEILKPTILSYPVWAGAREVGFEVSLESCMTNVVAHVCILINEAGLKIRVK